LKAIETKGDSIEISNIAVIESVEPKFYDCLKDVMQRREVFQANVHNYLTRLLTQYAQWEDDGISPSIHTRTGDAFILQMKDVFENHPTDRAMWYSRLRQIGETLLFSVGFYPESLYSKKKARPPFEYYTAMGSRAYDGASSAIRGLRDMNEAALMGKLAEDFKEYAGVLHGVRQEMGDHVKDVDILFALSAALANLDILNTYLLKQFTEEKKDIIH
jgi:hypothetical protein